MTGPAPFFSAKGDESDATLIKAAKLMGGEGRQRWTREKNEGIPANTFLKDVITAPLEYLRSDSYDISTQQIGYSMRILVTITTLSKYPYIGASPDI